MTTHWPNHVFCFLVAVTVVNVQNTANYFVITPKLDSLLARCLIAKQLINNKHLCTGTTPKKRRKQGTIEHSLIMVPIYKFFYKGDWSAVR